MQRSHKTIPITTLNYCEYIKQKLEVNIFHLSEKNINHYVRLWAGDSNIFFGLLYFSYIEFRSSKV